jgi:hypothetical protein
MRVLCDSQTGRWVATVNAQRKAVARSDAGGGAFVLPPLGIACDRAVFLILRSFARISGRRIR